MAQFGHTWWINFTDDIACSLSLDWWHPFNKFEFKRSLKIERFTSAEIPFISIELALWFVKVEWNLYA